MTRALGIHHVSSIVGDAQRNVDFYGGVLGLRLVKRTVNHDDPATHHLYFGDERGTPGSIVTFFPWGAASPGRAGVGQVAVTSFSVAPASLGWWLERLVRQGVAFERPRRRFDEQVIAFKDHDGLQLELVAHAAAETREGWSGGGVPREHAIRGLHAVTLWVHSLEPTAGVLTGALGFREVAREEGTARFAAGDEGPDTFVDVRAVGGFLGGIMGVGAVHHVAWRVADDDAAAALRGAVMAQGIATTDVIDRTYFRSVYFREPGGVLFELATDGPGFAVDEPPDRLGESLVLPPRFEAHRAEIEAVLPEIHPPGARRALLGMEE